jgi:tetratricopeptide (TPR) repeat protein
MSTMRFLRSAFFVLLAAGAGLGFAQESAPLSKSPVDQAETLLNEGKPREALSLLTQISEKDPKAPGLEEELGDAYFQLRQFSQATPHLKSALQQNADDLKATQLLAVSYVMTQQLDSARKVLAQMFYVPPGSAMAYLTLGKLMVRQQMVEAAVPQIETALQLDPRLTMAHFLLGEIDLYQSNAQGAVAEFQKELAVNPTLWLVYWRLGEAYMRLAKYDDAETVLKKAIWLNEASPGAFILLGELALKKNDPSLASGFLERALALDPQSFDAHYALATAYKALGRETEANQHFEISKKLRNEKQDTEKDSLLPAP